MSRLGQVWTACVFAVAGGLAGAAIAFRFLSGETERLAGVQ